MKRQYITVKCRGYKGELKNIEYDCEYATLTIDIDKDTTIILRRVLAGEYVFVLHEEIINDY